MSLVLGIDTGGTYTDGVLVNLKTQEIVAKAKALTTREDLTKGIRACIESLSARSDLSPVTMVSLSTTLATNAVVEGRGCEVGLLLIGHEPMGELPVHSYAVVQGGHDIKGVPMADLDPEEVLRAIEGFRGKVDAVAISGYLSVRNSEHELQAKELVEKTLRLPVVCAHQLTTSLGFHERTVTAVLNARLIPIIAELIESVKVVLNEKNIKAPLMIVKGDGTLMSEKLAREKPIETILSGPAASIVGATFRTQVDKALVVDMGGTTTDIAVLQDGVPKLNKEGARVGGWFTRVQAAEINTYGLGGDSYIQVNNDRKLVVGPQRVWPLATVAQSAPHLLDELKKGLEYGMEMLYNQPSDCFLLLKAPDRGLPEMEERVIELLEEGPHSLLYIAQMLGLDPNLLNLQRLINAGIIAKASLTPTDILHAQGKYVEWNRDASILGARILAYRMGVEYEEFLELALEEAINKGVLAILQSASNFEGGSLSTDDAEVQYFLEKILRPQEESVVELSAKIKVPIIAIGAPVKAYLPQIAQKLNTQVIIPEDAEVTNAIGAAIGKVVETVEVLIKPGYEGGFIVHAPWERRTFMYLEDAKAWALEEAKKHAEIAAEKAGAVDYQLLVHQEDIYAKMNLGWEQETLFMETIIEVTAVGRPQWDKAN